MTDLFESLGATTTPTPKNGAPIPITIPGTLKIGDAIFLAFTLRLNFVSKGNSGTATTGK